MRFLVVSKPIRSGDWNAGVRLSAYLNQKGSGRGKGLFASLGCNNWQSCVCDRFVSACYSDRQAVVSV